MRVRALAGFWTMPPKLPEWRSWRGPVTSTWRYTLPRSRDRQRRMVAFVETGVADHDKVSFEPVGIGQQPGLEVG